MSCFVPFSQFLEEEERNEFGTIAVGDPVAWISIVKTVEIEIILAKVQRLCDVPHEHNIIERTRTLLVQDCILAYASLPLLHNFQSSLILPRVDFEPQYYFRVAARFSQIIF